MISLSKRIILFSACATSLLTACGQNSRQEKIIHAPEESLPPLIKTALISDKPFFSLALLLKPEADKNRQPRSKDSAFVRAEMLRQLHGKSSPLKKFLITRGLPFGNDTRLLQQTLAFEKNPSTFSKVGFFEDHDLSIRIEIQNETLNSIVSTFEKRSKELGRRLAPQIIKEIAEKSPEDLEQIKRLIGIKEEKVNALVNILKKHEWIFSGYNFSSEEKTQILVLGLVAGVIVDDLSNNKTVQQIIAVAKDINQKVHLLAELCSLVHVMEINKQQIKADWQAMKSTLTQVHSQIDDLRSKADGAAKQSEVSRFIKDALTGRVQKVGDGSFLSERHEISKNIENFVSSAASAANSLDNLLNAAEAITAKVGITLGKDLQNAIATARTISSVVRVTNTIMNAYAGGGVIAALGVFGSGGTGLALLGANPGQSAIAADLRTVKQELKEIKMLQKQMIELQMDTVKMIRDLAIMSQAQHQNEMMLLQEIKGHAMVAEEAARMQAHSKVTSCEQMIEFGLQISRNYKALPFKPTSASTHLLAKNLLFKNLKSKEQLSQFIRSWSSNNFKQCQQAFVDAFSFSSAQESVLKLIINPADANSAIAQFHRNKYSPLVNFLFDQKNKNSLNFFATGLHLPIQRISEIQIKHSYSRVQPESFDHLYDLSTLISVDSLERYIGSLILLAPIVSFDKSTWMAFVSNEQPLDEHYELAWKRARHWFENALTLVQSAIAQETLLSGEVLVSELLPYLQTALKTREDCFQVTNSLSCVIKTNPVLRKNLMNYALHRLRKITRIEDDYKNAFEKLNVEKMEAVLGREFSGQIVKIKSRTENEVLAVRWGDSHSQNFTELPSIAEVYEERVIYSENMGRLLILQETVANAILEMTPTLLNNKEKSGLMNLYLSSEL